MRVFSFSGGRTSAYMTLKYAKPSDLVIFANTGKEHEGTLEFVQNVSDELERTGRKPALWLEYSTNETGYQVTDFGRAARHGEPFSALLAKKQFLPNSMIRFCTIELKIKVIEKYLKGLGADTEGLEMVLGIRYDEPSRYHKSKGISKSGFDNIMPLYDDKVTKAQVLNYWASQAFDLDIPEGLGNCDLCFLKGVNKRLSVLERFPEVGDWWAAEEIKLTEILGKKATFDKARSVSELIEKATKQQRFDFNAPDIECFCSAD